MRYIERNLEKVLLRATKQFPAIILTGPRQSGKTTLLSHIFLKTHKYVSMDNPDLRLMAINDPGLFFKNFTPPIIIDEIQYTPELFSYIKMLIDQHRDVEGQFVLTGSQSFPLMSKVTESLAGRVAVFSLLSFSFKEQFPDKTVLDMDIIKSRILSGGFPEIARDNKIDRELWFANYLQTYLERDIRQLRQIGDLTDFQRFLQLVSVYNGQAINLSNLSRDLGIAVNTVKAWISVLEASGLIVLIKPFYLNGRKRIIKSPKIYFLDTGLLCYLAGMTSPKQVFAGHISGQILETVVVDEIVRNFLNQGKVPRIYWWRTSSGEEVDFIVEDKEKIIPIEIKLSTKANKDMVKGLLSFCQLFPDKIDQALLVSMSHDKLLLSDKIISIPFNEFIYANLPDL